MYAGIDIGGTKTLVASLDNSGIITQKIRFETPQNYEFFLHELRFALHKLDAKDFHAGGVGAPGKIDRQHDRVTYLPNLKMWKDVSLQHDVERILHCPVIIENDAKMAALSEAMMVKDTHAKVLYITISTGIGYGLVDSRKIDTDLADLGGSTILVEQHGKLVPWESFASGHAIVERYGKKAQDITDKKTWHAIVRDLKPGLLELIAVTEPEIIIFGGSVGVYFERFGKILKEELDPFMIPSMPLPRLKAAARPEEAVLFGCYDLAKEAYGAIAR